MYNNFFSDCTFVNEILQTANMHATKYMLIIPSINPFMNNLPEKNNIKNNHKQTKDFSLRKEIKKIKGGKIIIKLVDFGKTSFQCPTS